MKSTGISTNRLVLKIHSKKDKPWFKLLKERLISMLLLQWTSDS